MSADPQGELARLREKLAKLVEEFPGEPLPEKEVLAWRIRQLMEREGEQA